MRPQPQTRSAGRLAQSAVLCGPHVCGKEVERISRYIRERLESSGNFPFSGAGGTAADLLSDTAHPPDRLSIRELDRKLPSLLGDFSD